mmetsp:Transcript_19710/g.23961  ORF Transcript_19710/g.23961 Transcript_19710/m.23961 type:complete len:293 (-) Transcript_19710:2697-3575(-)|eukprot:CAMPEP_0204863246 /NCGR_PEP_ID=MMETSP1348-20121228/3172_1 /ASSEMBLY_ACC=CAM_ASM_000700 /TAXON_ID=215587 /ORGANISM="Aplanochytrium stocchinoi, Strain GSBS06" /LENGTH=292 /DNA_ID=CAMNT_0052013527 /DNA_START=155 /DNA_END=1033 /DNA_ORIENTATION=+
MGNVNFCWICDVCFPTDDTIESELRGMHNTNAAIGTTHSRGEQYLPLDERHSNVSSMSISISHGPETQGTAESTSSTPTLAPASWYSQFTSRTRVVRRTLSNKALLEHKGSDSLDSVLSPLMAMPPSIEEERAFTKAALERRRLDGTQSPKECLLCMEGFTPVHPEVRTLCSCGVNKNSYHLSCLLTWRGRSGRTTCPVCDTELFFEDGANADAETSENTSTTTSTNAEAANANTNAGDYYNDNAADDANANTNINVDESVNAVRNNDARTLDESEAAVSPGTESLSPLSLD